jgi:hypothetical protein
MPVAAAVGTEEFAITTLRSRSVVTFHHGTLYFSSVI